jgi:ABC-2 type transport system permease protein
MTVTADDLTPGADQKPPGTPGYRSSVPSHPVSLRGAVASERAKFRSLRSSWLLLAAAVAGQVIVALLIGYNTRHLSGGLDPEDLTASATLQGYHLGELLLGALGVMFVSGEYATGSIRATLVTVPRRLPVLWAKLLVLVPLVVLTMTASAFVAFLSSQALVGHYRTAYSLSSPHALRSVISVGLYLGAVAVIGSAIAWIVRSTPGALVTYLGLLLVLPVLTGSLLGSWGRTFAEYLPSEAGRSLLTSTRLPDTLSTGVATVVLMAWVVGTVLLAVVSFTRRDA